MARFNIISNISNGIGLQRDYELLRDILQAAGHQVYGVQFNAARDVQHVDFNVFIETVVPQLFQCGTKNWLIPNPEWYQQQFIPQLAGFDRILCKTRDALKIFIQLVSNMGFGARVEHLGWESRDFFDAAVPRERKFLHVAGTSAMKNTPAIMQAWASGHVRSPLTIVSQVYASGGSIPNVRFMFRVSDEEMKEYLNSHIFHLCPSHYEGFGHALHESLAVGAIVLATDQAPMDEFHAALRVGTHAPRMQCLAQTWSVSGAEMIAGVRQMEEMAPEDVIYKSDQARDSFLKEREEFRRRIAEVLTEIPT